MNPLSPSETAFLAVHLQNDIVAEGGAFTPIFHAEAERNDTLVKAAELIGSARAASAPVVYVRIGFAPDYSDLVANVPLLQMAQGAGALINDTWQTEIHAAVAPAPAETVLTHARTSAFCETSLDVDLKALGINNVVVFGVATNASVEDSARWAANLGYRTVIAADASSAATREAHEAALGSFALFGETATNAEISEALAAAAR